MKNQVLIADGDESVRKMVARVLEFAGYVVTTVRNGQEAVAKLETTQPDLVLLDLNSAKPESWRVVEQVRRLRPWIPLILITALSNQQEPACNRGVAAFMEKPLDLPVLLKTIENLLTLKVPIRQDVGV